MTKKITIDATPREQLAVRLVGEEYLIRPLKGSLAIKMAKQSQLAQEKSEAGDDEAASSANFAMLDMADDMVRAMFGPKQAKKIFARLQDSEDDLDFEHIFQLMEKVSEAQAGDTPST